MKLRFWRKRLQLADVLIAAMDIGYVVKKRGNDTYVFTAQSMDDFRTCEFSGGELKDSQAYESMLAKLIAESLKPKSLLNHSGMRLSVRNWKK